MPTKILLTGGSGFVASHILSLLLERGHSVVTTVRSEEKAGQIRQRFSAVSKSKLDFAIKGDISEENAFEAAIKADPPFTIVIHTASPYYYNPQDIQRDLIDPAVKGTVGILNSIKCNAPSVRRVILTSSFVAVAHDAQGVSWDHTYTAEDWNPVTPEEATTNPFRGISSKTFAERGAWEFVEKEKPNFDLVTFCPPLVFGPVAHSLKSFDGLNTSNKRIWGIMTGGARNEIPDTGFYLWVDVRDLALSHVKAAEAGTDVANKRFLVIGPGYFNNKEIVRILHENFPKYAAEHSPTLSASGGVYPAQGLYRYDVEPVKKLLGVDFRPLDDCIVNFARSLENYPFGVSLS
ncbi:NADPH-dependent methylglyoxal reductase GRP2 [Penicillium cinerascens]|uniref:NADPH-dependent methylglyoxal reductase GRP2 n=1 Tax=Penicillium cinerascens TaxID=70096 RepID=A0A9W9NDL7_9EURO|nr:NADPH-dependent methylglyoxal reductase GRP2 [Penicillium cinerascens]KAJ5217936.1 NADPH-dependent methylglyoxal reductase GRP2 [Penicillium cinerascens]